MGWWTEGKMTVGDEPIDRLVHALEQVRHAYREAVEREPTHAELAWTVETALRSVLDAASDNARVVPAVKIRTQALKKQRVQVGDVFVIRLDKCHFGRVIYKKAFATWVELYRQTSDRPVPVQQLDTSRKNVRHHKWVVDKLVFEGFRWKVIGHVPVPDDYQFPDYLMGDGDLAYASRGPEGKELFRPTRREVRKRHLEPVTILDPDAIEANLQAGRDDPWPEILEIMQRMKYRT